jgi:hypothetical protein
MSESPQAPTKAASPATTPKADHHHATGSGAKIHRVCIGCNNMFEVTMENYEAKHCSACHKG